ncbi:MAG: cytochrome c biogenesis protein CcsA [Acidobacteria bacterium]|nr:cytochrome c biogenesis protein CcsA [Acidobacteriota bacterium]MBI3470596.1 cytochrome c biogenesis protein CcsA [Candidatus Solibacter usitatus]
MRKNIIYVLAVVAAVLLVRNLEVILLRVPVDAEQGNVYRNLYFHVPSAFTSLLGSILAAVASIAYLVYKDLKYDALAVATVEVAMVMLTVTMVTGSIWARVTWGIWWTWDARLTSTFVGWLLSIGYLVLRTAIEEPTARARISAVYAIFASADVPIIWFSIEWFRTQHPAPVLRAGGYIDPAMKSALYWNVPAILLVGVILVLLRLRQEEMRRELDGLRRLAHTLS